MSLILGFDVLYGKTGGTDGYILYLINNSNDGVTANYTFLLNEQRSFKGSLFLKPKSYERIGKMTADNLNDRPVLDVEAWRTTTLGHDKRFNRKLKVKAKQFFNNYFEVPVMYRDIHVFEIFPHLVGNEELSLKEDAKQKKKENTKEPLSDKVLVDKIPSIVIKSQFPIEIDLHIEKLDDKKSRSKPAEIFNIQMNAFDQYINQAINIGMDTVYIIHGLGKGTLKKEIHRRLNAHPHVKSFKNEHHPRYGFGATEVSL